MTDPSDVELLELATPYALNAVSDTERAEIERRLATAPAAVAQAFSDEVRAVQEAMAAVSASTQVEPPDQLRNRVLAAAAAPARRQIPWRTTLIAAAAAVVVGVVTLSVGLAVRPGESQSTAEQVFTAPDVRTVSTAIPVGGTATVVFSREQDAGVLVMNDVPRPTPGTVYQMWLVGNEGTESAGTMDAAAITASTTAVLQNLDNASLLAFTIESGSGSIRPTGAFVAELPLT